MTDLPPSEPPGAAPVDLAQFTWARSIDWALGLGSLAITVLAAFVVLPGATDFPGLAILLGLAGLYGVSWWRCHRMATGLSALAATADQGWIFAAVQLGSGKFLQWVGSGQVATISVRDRQVRLDGTTTESWPASSVSIGAAPNWLRSRGLELLTPSGARYVSFVRPGDPAVYLRIVIDRQASHALARALAAQQMGPGSSPSSPPGWHADPGGAPQLRWWDGSAWTNDVRPNG